MQQIYSTILSVPYSEWGPMPVDKTWERLDVCKTQQRWKESDAAFHLKDYWNPDRTELVSEFEQLNYIRKNVMLAFAAEHFLRTTNLGYPNPKILEIGATPMSNYVIKNSLYKTNTAILADNPDFRCAAIDSVNPYNETYVGNSDFFLGNFLSKKDRDKIEEWLGGKPDVILGSMVFEERLGTWMNDTPTYPAVDESKASYASRLARAANNFLADGGVLAIDNHGYGRMPEFISLMPPVALYEVDVGEETYHIKFYSKLS